MITTKNHKLKHINAGLLLQKVVPNLCYSGHVTFAAVQIINEGRGEEYVDELLDRQLLNPELAFELRSIIRAYNS